MYARLADVTSIFLHTVDRVGELHVIGGHGLGDGAGRGTRLEKLARHLLAGANFDDGAVFLFVQVDAQRFFQRGAAADILVHDKSPGCRRQFIIRVLFVTATHYTGAHRNTPLMGVNYPRSGAQVQKRRSRA